MTASARCRLARPAFLLGHLTAELPASLLGLTVLTLTGLVVGWRIHSGVGDALAGFALLVAFAIAMLWVGTLRGHDGRARPTLWPASPS